MPSFRQFIRSHREEIDNAIHYARYRHAKQPLHTIPKDKVNDEERRLWVLNDEGLYNLARRNGVKV